MNGPVSKTGVPVSGTAGSNPAPSAKVIGDNPLAETGTQVDWSRAIGAAAGYYSLADGRMVSMPFYSSTAITFPLLSPTPFFLLVVNVLNAFFDTFGVINLDLGGSSAQLVILMLAVVVLTAGQFRFVERRAHY